ncbi:MAG: RES family NAD+ phosphorylase [Thermomicrobiales bacterium]
MSIGHPNIQPWIGSGYRHKRQGGSQNILDFQFAGMGIDNRWNKQGSPTLYLAGDRGVVAAEWGRHLGVEYAPDTPMIAQRTVFRLTIRLDSAMDLRAELNVEALGVTWSPTWFLDGEMTLGLAERIREESTAQAIIVPSIAFVDDLTRWNLVVFLDKVPEDTNRWVVKTESIGHLQWKDL